jgi:hypothetical protein
VGVNNWTSAQWRAYNALTGDRHVNRRLLPIRQHEALKEDLAQQRELFRLSRRKADDPELYKRREMTFIRLTRPMVYVMTGDDVDEWG